MRTGLRLLQLLFIVFAVLGSVVLASAAWAADPMYVSSAQATETYRSLAIRAPSDAKVGDVLIAQVTYVGGSSRAVAMPTGWTRLYKTDNGRHVGQAIYWKIAQAADASVASYTWTFDRWTDACGSLGRYRFVEPTSPVAASSAAVSRSSTLTASGVTSPTRGLVLALYGDKARSTWRNTPAGFVVRWAQTGTAPGIAGMDAIISGATGNKSITAAADYWVAHLLALRPDVTGPSVTITQGASQADPTNGRSVVFDVVLSEPVTGLTDSVFTYGGTANGFSTHTLTGSGSSYVLTVSGTSVTDGTVTVSLPAGRVADAAGNANLSSTSSDNSVTYDGSAPTGSISIPPVWTDASAVPNLEWVATRTPALVLAATDGTAGSGVTSMRLSVDDGEWGPWTSFATTAVSPSLGADGLHRVGVQYRDAAGNVTPPIYGSTRVDSVGPAGAVALPAYTNSRSFSANFTGIRDPSPGCGPATYRYRVDGAVESTDLAFAPGVTCSLPSDSAQGVHTLTFRFRDHVANSSSAIGATTTYDSVAPTAVVTAPATNGTVSAATSTTITGTASDATSGVSAVSLTIRRSSDGLFWNGIGWQPSPYYLAANGTTTWTYEWFFEPARQSGGSPYTIQAKAIDNAANTGTSAEVTGVRVQNSFTLTYTAGAHGTITGTSPQTVAYGASGTQVRAVPDAGYHFVGWSDGVTTAARTDANVTASLSVTASFAADSFTRPASGLAVVGKYAYVASGDDGLQIVDVSDPQSPRVLGHCDTPGMASDVTVRWPHAYVADGAAGLQVVDVRDPAHPAIVTSLPLPSSARRLCFSSGPLLEDFESTSGFSAWGNGSLALDTTHVKHGSASVKMAVAGGGYLELYRNNVTWDLSRDRGALQMWVYAKSAEVGASADPWNIHLGICLSNDSGFSSYYTAVSNRQVHEGWNLLRFSTADWVASGSASWSRPVSRMLMYCSSPGSRSVELSFDELRSGVRGVMPAFMWRFDDGYDEVYQDVLPYLSGLGQKGTMYLRTDSVGTGGRYITLPHLQALYDAGWALGNHTSDHTDLTTVDQATAAAKISAGTSWLLSHGFPRAAYHLAYPYDFTNATARAAAAQSGILSATRAGSVNQQLPVDDPLYLNSFPMSGGTSEIEAWKATIDKAVASGGTMIIGCHDFTSIYQNETLPLFKQIADYVAQQRLWTPTIDEWWDTLQMQAQAGSAGAGPWLYVACDAGIQVVDLPDPTTPVLAGGLAAAGAADVDAYDAGACVAVEGVGLQVVGVPDPGSPTLAGSLSTGSAWSSGICVRGARTYVAAGADGLRIVSTADPAHPVLLGTLDTPGDARDVTVVGSKAYLADGQAGIQVIDVSDPSRPALVATHDLSAAANALVVFGHNAYVATDQGTLRVVSLPTGE